MTEEEIIKIRFVETRYKQFDYAAVDEDDLEPGDPDEPNWAAMGLTPSGQPMDDDEEDGEFPFEWIPITIDILDVWGVSSYEEDTIVWTPSRSIAVDMKVTEAVQKFLHAKLHI